MIRPHRLPFVRVLIAILLAWPLCHAPEAGAHESRPAYLQINEIAPDRYGVIWQTPVLSGMRLPVVLKLPDGVRDIAEPFVQESPGALLQRRKIEITGGLGGKRIDFVGLQATITDVLVRVAKLDGAHSTTLVHPAQSYVDLEASRGLLATAGTFLVSGIEHILLGVDHLLFILGLLLIVKSTWMLVKTITAFTVAHSITLAIATLGYAQIPVPPLNAAIALSILFLGPEIVRTWRGETSFTIRNPWVVAFAFGLLHGFGFERADSNRFAVGRDPIGLAHVQSGCRDRATRLRCAHPSACARLHRAGDELAEAGGGASSLPGGRARRVLDHRAPCSHAGGRTMSRLPAFARRLERSGGLRAFWTIDRLIVMAGGVT
jgi:hydrogenase/urease accessory protein HupE